jgi:hemolysin III
MSEQLRYTTGEEMANSATHAAGVLLSIAGLVVMLGRAVEYGDVWHRISSIVFGLSLITLYSSSALYHGLRNAIIKARLQLVDHAAIYVLIAGSYTPFMLVNLRGPWGWSVLAIVWSLAIAGVVFEFKPGPPSKKVTVGLSVAMGWCGVAIAGPMLRSVETNGLWLLLMGGLFYTLGIVFYLAKNLRYHHAIWHLFVLAGSAAHYFSILYFVIPVNGSNHG